MNPKHIEMRGVRKSYRFFTLDDLSLDLAAGEVMGFVGPNGAGKSTTLRLAMGMIAPDAGEIRVLGHAMPEAQALAKREVGYVSAEMRLLPHSTLGWHMNFVKSIYPEWDGGYAAALVKRFNLRPEQNARSLSLGEHIKAVLLLALARRPRLLNPPPASIRWHGTRSSPNSWTCCVTRAAPSCSPRTTPSTWNGFRTASPSSIAAVSSAATTRRIFSTAGAASICNCRPVPPSRSCRASLAAWSTGSS
jgi:ABC-type transport system involved in cytochrome c biogenesis ATPase subunit